MNALVAYTSLVVLLFFATCMLTTTSNAAHAHNLHTKQRVVLISFDGFRHDFVERHNLGAFKKFARRGVRSSSLKPVFTTKTFPNHFTMATGLYEESHGIVGNRFYDPVFNDTFVKSNDPKWWNNNNGVKPLWMVNEEHVVEGTNRTGKSATIFWPGSMSSYQGKWPSFAFKKYNASYSTRDRFDKIVELLLDNPDLNLVTCYMEEPDNVAHKMGPESDATKTMLRKVDADFDFFQRKMNKAGLLDKVNIIIVSDHGFTTIPKKNVRYLSDHFNATSAVTTADFHLDTYGVLLHIRPRNLSKKAEVYEAFKQFDHLTVYYKEDIPDRWHYRHNRRVPDIIAVAELHFYFAPDRSTWIPSGDHGYDNELPDMHGIFMARGPAFKKNLKTGEVLNVDICALVCHLLNVSPHPNNGSLARVQSMILEKNLLSVIAQNPSLIIALLSICGIFVSVVILGCTVSCYRNFVESSKYRKVHGGGGGEFGDDNVPLAQWHDDDDDVDVTEYQLRR